MSCGESLSFRLYGSAMSTITSLTQVDDFGDEQQRKLFRAITALCGVVLFGTLGFTLIQDNWDIWKALYFTLITITTVGYGDYGLTPAGERFATLLLVVGIATATYAFGQIVQAAISYQLAWRRRMQKAIDQLHDHYIICGAGRVGQTVCERLAEKSMPFVVVEKDADRMQWVRSHGSMVLEGAATEDELLILAGIQRAKGLICATESDSDNIVITLSARELNPDIQIISRVNDNQSMRKLHRAGATRVVAPAIQGGNDIAELLIHPNLSAFLDQSSQTGGGYELAEVRIEEGSLLVGQTLLKYGTAEQSLVFVAVRDQDGKTRIRPGANEKFVPGQVAIVVGEPDAVERMCQLAQAVAAFVEV